MASIYRLLTLVASSLVVPALYARSLGNASARERRLQRLGHIPRPSAESGSGPETATGKRLGPDRARRVWIQAVSVGEVRTAETFARSLRASGRDLLIDLSSTTDAGLARGSDLARAGLVDRVFAYPLDRPAPVRRALDAVGPAAYGTIETEI